MGATTNSESRIAVCEFEALIRFDSNGIDGSNEQHIENDVCARAPAEISNEIHSIKCSRRAYTTEEHII